MEIKAEKWIIDEDVSYKILEIKKCCDRLINSDYIDINDEYEDNDNENNYSVKLCSEEHYNSYGDIFSEEYYETINFCPYCGSPINIEIANTIDKTEEYNVLIKERNILWHKCCETDSKKEEEMLEEQVREMDEQINNMLMSDDFEDYLERKQ